MVPGRGHNRCTLGMAYRIFCWSRYALAREEHVHAQRAQGRHRPILLRAVRHELGNRVWHELWAHTRSRVFRRVISRLPVHVGHGRRARAVRAAARVHGRLLRAARTHCRAARPPCCGCAHARPGARRSRAAGPATHGDQYRRSRRASHLGRTWTGWRGDPRGRRTPCRASACAWPAVRWRAARRRAGRAHGRDLRAWPRATTTNQILQTM
jgi:hypothetical protein